MHTDLVVALDYSQKESAEKLIRDLEGLPLVYKVGLELFMDAGPAWVKDLSSHGVRVFLDLKFHDIPNTTGAAVMQAARLGVEFVTVHLSGGKRMLDEIEIRLEEAELSGKIKKRPNILGVSVLTSFQDEDWIANVSHVAKMNGIRSIEDAVDHYAGLVHGHPAVGGMVCSPKEIEMVRAKFSNLYLMVPGIRPVGAESHDQNRVLTPSQAHSLGASAIVVGRPITQAPRPREVTESILKEIK